MDKNSDKIKLPLLVLVVGRKCTLRCKDCSNLIPYSPKETMEYDIDELLQNLNRITDIATIEHLQIQGGEPFIYPHLKQLLLSVVNNTQILNAHIATNGTVIPEELDSRILAHPKLEVRISAYPGMEKKIASLQQYLYGNNIKNTLYGFKHGTGEWSKLGGVNSEPFEEDPEQMFQKCLKKSCLTLEDGLLGHCARSIKAPQIQNFESNDGDYVNVQENDLKKKLADYIKNPNHMKACVYCGGYDTGNFVKPAVQLRDKEKLKEQT